MSNEPPAPQPAADGSPGSYPPPGYGQPPPAGPYGGQPYPPYWGPPPAPRRKGAGFYIGLFLIAWFGVGIIVVIVMAANGAFSPSGPSGSAGPGGSQGRTEVSGGGVDGAWLNGRWCSGVDAMTFDSARRTFYFSAQQQGTYELVGNRLTMTAPGGASNTVTVTRQGADTIILSSPSMGSETARRC